METNLFSQLDLMLKVLSFKDKSAEFRNTMKEVDLRVEVEFNGSRTLRDIETLRKGCELLDKGMHFNHLLLHFVPTYSRF